MSNTFTIPTPEDFSFRRSVGSHGWYDLMPFEYDEKRGRLTYSYFSSVSRCAEAITITRRSGSLTVNTSSATIDRPEARAVVRHILRLDEDLKEFYESVSSHDGFDWIRRISAGRLLRSGTVWEDLVKTLCTTNCSWSLTKSMTRNLVEKLGRAAADGRKAFPTAEAIAATSAEFFRDEIRAGYRSPYFIELANSVASGDLDPESWLCSDLPTPELRKEIKKVKGVGDYAADNLLKLLGRYDGLALDSWLRASFYKRHNREKACDDKKIERHYRKFGKWKGLAMWCDMTKEWFGEIE
jgi:3-methyladenine DNA glycosylase/8-oxoguanine DNA glycosylase